MNDPVASKGVDRAVARVLTQVAAATPTVRPGPADSPARDPAGAPDTGDVAAVGSVAARLASNPPVDAERVAQIKKAIANGTFPILPATIADRILALRYDWMSRDSRSL